MRFALVGPTYPYRGGIAHHTTLLARCLAADPAHEVLLISFSRQYPGWLYRGRSDRDPSDAPLHTPAEYLLDPLSPWRWPRVTRRLRQWGPEALILPWWVPFWAPVWAYLGRAGRRLPGKPALLFICHNVLPHEPGPFDRPALRLALSPGDGFVVHSHADAATLSQLLPGARVRVTPLPTYAAVGAPASAAGPRGGAGPEATRLPGLPLDDRPWFLMCGLIRPYKGLDVLLAAWPGVVRERPAHLVVAGEFWHDSEPGFRRQIAALGLEEHVTLINQYLPDERLAAYVRQASAVILPYRSATQSAVVQLAFGHGTPVITTRVGGLPEAVDDGQTGLLAAPQAPEQLAGAVVRYLNEGLEPVFRANIAARQDRFGWDRLVTALVDLARDRRDRAGRSQE